MSTDLLVLNHATADIRLNPSLIKDLVSEDGMSINRTDDVSNYLSKVEEDKIIFGGCGNLAPLVSRAGLEVALAVNIGKGNFDGLDKYGRRFCDVMASERVNLEHVFTHETLSTAVTLIGDSVGNSRGGMVYFPNANDDIDFERFKEAVEDLNPKIVHYMYAGLSRAGDRNKGNDLADFLSWCNDKNIITSVDCHTLTSDIKSAIESGEKIKDYELLLPVLPVTDVFFTSSDESKVISNSLDYLPNNDNQKNKSYLNFLYFLMKNNLGGEERTKLFGVTFNKGAYATAFSVPSRRILNLFRVESRSEGEVIDLVGAGDSFRAGVLTYICKNLGDFQEGNMAWPEAIEMGNLFASRFIKSPLDDRYGSINSYEEMIETLRRKE